MRKRRADAKAEAGVAAEATPDTGDAYFAIDQFTAWINNADTKAGFLAAALAILIDAIAAQARVRPVLAGLGSAPVARELAGSIATGAAAVFAALCTGYLISAVVPRVRTQPFSRYSWPCVARVPAASLVGTRATASRAEAWATAHSLALIAETKYRRLRVAFVWWIAALLALFAVLLIG